MLTVTFERKYYHCDAVFIQRSLRPREFRIGNRGLHIPRISKERFMNEAASLQYIRETISIFNLHPIQFIYLLAQPRRYSAPKLNPSHGSKSTILLERSNYVFLRLCGIKVLGVDKNFSPNLVTVLSCLGLDPRVFGVYVGLKDQLVLIADL